MDNPGAFQKLRYCYLGLHGCNPEEWNANEKPCLEAEGYRNSRYQGITGLYLHLKDNKGALLSLHPET